MHTEKKWFTASNNLSILTITLTLTLIPLKSDHYSLDRTLTHKNAVPRHIVSLYITTAVTFHNIVIS